MASASPRSSTPRWSTYGTATAVRRAASPRSTSVTACSRCTRSHPTSRRAAPCGAACHERPRCLALGAHGRRPGCRRARARCRGRRRAPPRRRRARVVLVAGAAVPGRAHRSAACGRPPHPGPRRNDDHPRRTPAGDPRPSTTAVLTMELQNGVVGEGAMLMGALVDELASSGHARHRATAVHRRAGRRRARRALHGRRRVPTAPGPRRTARSSRSSAKQRREHGSTATDLGSPGAELIAGLEDPATSWCRDCTA